ncbi:MAG: PaaI family thioesterase [Planctomycetaceae bacterium]|jgi:acyl-CoA thioesterase|nr:PaaI family thioesterase [Planctomycetaceae bacterium]
MELSKEQIVERFKADRYATEVTGIEIVDARPGYAKTKLLIQPKHFNAVGIVQGGVLFTLADFAFAVASNNGVEEITVAIECNISFLKPTTAGILYAEAILLSKTKSLASYDIPVTNENGELVAKFYGRGFVRQPKKENK